MEVRCLARTLHYSWPTCTWHKIIELILLWRCLGRGGLLWNTNSWGASCLRNQHHPCYANPVLGQYWTMSCSQAYFGEVTMALVIILFCRKILPLHELGILCWGTPPHPHLPTTPRILDSKLSCHDQMRACLLRLDVAISYLLLLRSTCHDPSFMPHYPSSFCEPTTIHLSHWPTQSYLNWFTPANVSMP